MDVDVRKALAQELKFIVSTTGYNCKHEDGEYNTTARCSERRRPRASVCPDIHGACLLSMRSGIYRSVLAFSGHACWACALAFTGLSWHLRGMPAGHALWHPQACHCACVRAFTSASVSAKPSARVLCIGKIGMCLRTALLVDSVLMHCLVPVLDPESCLCTPGPGPHAFPAHSPDITCYLQTPEDRHAMSTPAQEGSA
nr:hypothetical protein CFP56_02506 [Quercus suber]